MVDLCAFQGLLSYDVTLNGPEFLPRLVAPVSSYILIEFGNISDEAPNESPCRQLQLDVFREDPIRFFNSAHCVFQSCLNVGTLPG